jgi:RNA polymerase sigma-70 factor (ECF subfamily)
VSDRRDTDARLEACVAEHYASVLRYFRRRCPTEADAEDAATEVFTVAWRRIGELPEEPQTRLWLFGVARRVLANQVRARRRRERLDDRLSVEHYEPLQLADHAVGTLERLSFRTAWHSLSTGDRELLALLAWEGLSAGEIAQVLRVPAPVVSARLYRARRRLEHRMTTIESRSTACLTSSST